MNSTKSPNEPNIAPPNRLIEVPRFFNKPSQVNSKCSHISETLEHGEAQFREDFQARWWPGDMTTFSPPPKG
jgi:hypothetical protein